MHLRSVRKRSLKVREQQEAVTERIQASKNKYGHIEPLDFVNLVTVCYCRRRKLDCEAKAAKCIKLYIIDLLSFTDGLLIICQ